ncbi:MAG: ester cyclase [Haliangiales bacterium]
MTEPLGPQVQLVKRYFDEVVNGGNRELIPELWSDPGAVGRGMEKIRQLRDAFPDLRLEVERYEHVGEFVIAYFVGNGTHTGSLMGRPPTGKSIRFEGSNIYRVRDGKLAAAWGHLNTQDAFRELFK